MDMGVSRDMDVHMIDVLSPAEPPITSATWKKDSSLDWRNDAESQ